MKTIRYIFIAVAATILFTDCGLYKKYEQSTETPENIFGESQAIKEASGDTASIGQISWREFFTDPVLQQLIDQALANNTDLNSARLSVEMSKASLEKAKKAFLPSLSFSPQGTLSSFDNSAWSRTYSLPLDLSWDIDIFGSLTNQKRAAKATLLQSEIYEEVVRTNLISTVAQYYFYLQLLDREMEILIQTDTLWKASLETERAFYENGKAYSTAVNQQESSYLSVKTQIVDTRRSIIATENALCKLLAIPPQHIKRSEWGKAAGSSYGHMLDPQFLKLGVPAVLIENRPDIRMANAAMEEAFYNTQAARAAFYPSITLSGTLGWANSNGGVVVDPGALLLNAMGQLTQPIFARGKLKAQLKTSKLNEEDLQRKYVQTVIDAGNEVNEAMADCQAAAEKKDYYKRQVDVLNDAYIGTHELMDNGKASYLEVLTAQESLLSAQLNEAENMYKGAIAVVSLYIALGGGTK